MEKFSYKDREEIIRRISEYFLTHKVDGRSNGNIFETIRVKIINEFLAERVKEKPLDSDVQNKEEN